MKYQTTLRETALATILITGSVLTLPVFAHQSVDNNTGHHNQQSGVSPNMMMTEKMGNMDMSRMMGQMGSMNMSAMMEKMSSMNISMMMGKNKGINMMQKMGVTNLTGDQQNSINNLHDSMRKNHWELMGSAMDEQVNLREVLRVDRPDPKSVGEIYGRLFNLKRKMIESRIETRNAVLDLLSEEQVEQMQNKMMMSGGHGHGKNKGATNQDS
jgi:hypothetical protein